MRNGKFFRVVFLILPLASWFLGECQGIETELWSRFETQFTNHQWQGNPHDVVFQGIFLSPSGRTVRHLGFYAGEDTWKIYFMPDEVGKWTYRAAFSDLSVEEKSGEFVCVDSELDAPLLAAGNRWQLKSGRGEFPVIWNPPVQDGVHWGFRGRELSDPTVQEALQYSDEVVGARLLGFGEIMIVPIDWASDWPQDAVPYICGKEGEEFHLPFWDQLNAKLDAARDRNMGAYIMLYSDDAMAPDHFGLTPQSTKELRLMRYVVARLASYPHILWDSGIDIGEYRDHHWIEWYANWFRQHDPWQHPVGSRSGGGSGGFMPDSASYFSAGGADLPSRSELLQYLEKKVPVAHTDHWRPFISRGNWTHDKIRISHWRCGLTGAQAVFSDYNQGKVDYQAVATGARYVGVATHFFRRELHCSLQELQPQDELIKSGDRVILAAKPGKEYVAYDEDGGDVTIAVPKGEAFRSIWYDPRRGGKRQAKQIETSEGLRFSSPTKGQDWVLHIVQE